MVKGKRTLIGANENIEPLFDSTGRNLIDWKYGISLYPEHVARGE
jgi:hypothetical protein